MDTAIGNVPPRTYYVVKPVQDPKNPLLKYEVVHHSDQNKTIGASKFKCAPKRYTLEQLNNLPKIIEAKQKLNFEVNQSFSYSLPDQGDFEEKMPLPKNQIRSRG